MMSLLSELVTFVYSNGPVKVTTVTPESIYAKVWSKAKCEITGKVINCFTNLTAL